LEADAFRQRYYGKIADSDLSAATLVEALHDYQALQLKVVKPYLFAQLHFYSDSEDMATARLLDQVKECWQGVHEQTLFFDLELLRLEDDQLAALLADPGVAAYGHFLTTTRAQAPYTLSETVEQALKRKDLSGRDAFVQLFDEVAAAMRFSYRFPDEEQEREVVGEELLALLYHPQAEVRESSFSAFLEGHGEQSLVLTSCFNNILLDHGKEAELRSYPDLMTPTHLSSETAPEMVEQMLTVSEQHYPLAQEYFALKRRMLKLDVLKNTDIYAPVAQTSRSFDFDEAKALVRQSFAGFAPELAAILDRLYQGGRLDVAPRPGKSGGAFCMGLYPGADPYVLLNFSGTLRDVSTLAHELGHAVHYVLSGAQNYMHYHAPLPLAETASVFGEMLLTRNLLEQETDNNLKIALLCAKLEEMIATTMRQTVLTRFEQAVHQRRGEELLSTDDYCELWLQENAKLFGDQVEMIPQYRWGWAYISHFIHARFYCYSYVFGELLVLALYQQYRQQGAAFVPLFLDLLRAGGSAPPVELVKPLGIDLTDPGFWAQGYGLMGEMLQELKGLIDER
ncbi:MAG: M3 family oligoendopeptidase, partial [Desulfuromonadales bacterium]|nr:M3 family oligoendopeptidase [Desulfuromonadales bacterium]